MTDKQLLAAQLKTDKTLGEIADEMGIAYSTLLKRIKDNGLKTGRKRGRETGYRKPLKAK